MRIVRQAEYEAVSANLNDVFTLLDDCGKAYRLAGDNERRCFNQSLFERMLVHEEKPIEADYAEPFSALLNPEIIAVKREFEKLTENINDNPDGQPESVAHFSCADILGDLKTKTSLKIRKIFSAGLSKDILLPPTGLEPARFPTGKYILLCSAGSVLHC